jgi:hypothetical protein
MAREVGRAADVSTSIAALTAAAALGRSVNTAGDPTRIHRLGSTTCVDPGLPAMLMTTVSSAS